MATVLCVGIATLDFVLAVDQLPGSPGKYRASDRLEVGGGVAANASVTVARLGGRSVFAGRVGTDDVGDRIVAGLASEGVDVSAVERVEHNPSPFSVAFVDAAGERLIVNHAGPDLFAAGEVTVDEVDAVVSDMRWPAGGLDALRAATELGVPGVLDCDHDPSGREEILSLASHVIFAMPTLLAYMGTSDPRNALAALADRTDAWLAATDGAAGVYWRDGSHTAHHAAFEVAAVDTLGAGDVFHGAFALGLAEGMDEATALPFASAAAAIKCTRFGGRQGIPHRAEVDALVQSQGSERR